MSLDPPPYLSSIQNNIRARPIPWEGAVRAGSITDEQLKKIKSVDKVRPEQRRETVESEPESYVTLFVGGSGGKSILESAAKRNDIIQYILVLAGDLVNDAPSLVPALIASPDPYKPFLPLLERTPTTEDPIPLLTSAFLTSLVSASLVSSSKPTPRDETALPKLFTYLSTLTRNQDSGLQDIGVRQNSALLRTQRSREIFWSQRNETVQPLVDTLRAASGGNDSPTTLGTTTGSARAIDTGIAGGIGLQLLYNVLLVIWQLSFEASLVGDDLESDYEILIIYTQLVRVSKKEKITRLLLSTLYNLLTNNRTSLLPIAASVSLPEILQNKGSGGRHVTDPELLDDRKALTELLDDYTKKQTTFDEYSAEVLSGHLRWTPPHKNPTFWKENARRILKEENGQLPKKLSEIISKNWETDKQVLAIACNDVGCLVKEVPDKRAQLEKLGLKARVMELMADSDETVRWESLRAVGEWLRYTFES